MKIFRGLANFTLTKFYSIIARKNSSPKKFCSRTKLLLTHSCPHLFPWVARYRSLQISIFQLSKRSLQLAPFIGLFRNYLIRFNFWFSFSITCGDFKSASGKGRGWHIERSYFPRWCRRRAPLMHRNVTFLPILMLLRATFWKQQWPERQLWFVKFPNGVLLSCRTASMLLCADIKISCMF